MSTNPPYDLTDLITRMREHNESIETLATSLSLNSLTQIRLKKRLETLAHIEAEGTTEQALLSAHAESLEVAATEGLSPTSFTLASHLASLANSPEHQDSEIILAAPRSLKDILAAKKAAALSSEFSDDSDSFSSLSMDDIPEETATIYEAPEVPVVLSSAQAELSNGTQESFSLNIILNEKQLAAKEMALMGKNYVLIGPAGSGKTTAQRAVAETLLESQCLSSSRYKTYCPNTGERLYLDAPSIAFVAYTRRAAQNLAKAIHKSPILAKELKNNIMTIHALLEFEPETYFDPIDKKDKFRFIPRRNAENPLEITHLVIEESSMLGLDLWTQLYDALPPGVQIIFIGDINQLPPVFGPSILNYALVQLPIVELTETYRNQGIVLENAHHILKGEPVLEDENFVIVRGKNPVQVGQSKMSYVLGAMFKQLHEATGSDGLLEYDPEDCIILSPWNKQELGTDNLNKWISQFLGEKRGAIVNEVIAGFAKLYLAVGDKVMFNKRDAVITDITRNINYHGKEPQMPGSDLTRFGIRIIGAGKEDSLEDISLDYSGFNLEDLEKEKAERKQQASHIIRITYDDERFDDISAAGDFAPQTFSLGYALTVHKAQGSEWRKVFIVLHKDFAVSLYRELFYTAVTRARTKVTIIAKDTVIEKAIKNQRIKGNTLKDKLEYFNSGADMRDGIYTSKVA